MIDKNSASVFIATVPRKRFNQEGGIEGKRSKDKVSPCLRNDNDFVKKLVSVLLS